MTRLLGVLAIAILVGGCSAAAPIPSQVSPPSSGGICLDVIAAAKLGHSGSTVTFSDPTTGATEDLVLPPDLSTRVTNDRAQLLGPGGGVIGSEGDVLTLGGGGSPFVVCTVNGVNYLKS
ncbi:MAG TPA: hypothetical protein VF494_05385 [Candidatus Limnocylindrales bacterium]